MVNGLGRPQKLWGSKAMLCILNGEQRMLSSSEASCVVGEINQRLDTIRSSGQWWSTNCQGVPAWYSNQEVVPHLCGLQKHCI